MITFLELANMVDATQEVGSWVYYYFTFFSILFIRFYKHTTHVVVKMIDAVCSVT